MQSVDERLIELAGEYYSDPIGFTKDAFLWGEGDLAGFDGLDTWQEDFLRDLGKSLVMGEAGIPIPNDELPEEEWDTISRFAVSSGHGTGKAQPKSLEIDTPSGRAVWGELKAGDYVFGRNGKPTRILGTYDQGERDIYRVTFDDGSSTLCDGEHIWAVRGRQERRKKLSGWRNMTAKEILDCGVTRKNGPTDARQWEIPSADPVEFPRQDVPIDPYTMGVWLGDGCCNGRITSMDAEIAEYAGARQSTYSDIVYIVPGLRKALRENQWLNSRSFEKSVPDCYKYNTPEVRLAVLRGLMDTDGTVDCRHGKAEYCTTSPKLYEDFLWLARSLGYKAYCRNPLPRSYKKDGKVVQCRDAYVVRISGYTNPFRLKRKANKWSPPTQERYTKRWISSIEFSHRESAMCIKVEAEDSLYLTNDFIVTHNTALIAIIILWYMVTRPRANIRVTANTEAQLRSTTWPELALWQKRCIFKDWFLWEATRFSKIGERENWYAEAISWSEQNPDAFAGKHGRYYMVIMDEASGIADNIFETTRGSITTDGNCHLVLGNPIRPSGGFYDIFHSDYKKKRWNRRHINSLETKTGNSGELRAIFREYGESHDVTRRRVLGQFPRQAASQFISTEVVEHAIERRIDAPEYENFPAILGVDVARFGDDRSALVIRQGPKLRYIETIEGADTVQVANMASNLMLRHPEIAVAFVDEVGVGAGVLDVMRRHSDRVIGVNVGRRPNNMKVYKNQRVEIWDGMRKWLETADIPNHEGLQRELIQIEYDFTDQGQMRLERKIDMKARGLPSPDIADAVALTFAGPEALDFEMFDDDEWQEPQDFGGRSRVTGY